MPTYLYCLLTLSAEPDSPPPIARGIGGAAVRILPAGPLEAWVSTIASSPPTATVEAVREHDAVVSAALATGRTPLPARFGQIWPSDADCATAVAQRREELESFLRHVAGTVEMTVCTLLPGMPPAPSRIPTPPSRVAKPGTEYMLRLRARADRERHLRFALETLRARVSRALGPISRGEIAEIRGSDEALALSVSYLVERGKEPEFRRAVDEVSRESAARLVIVGPRAPYSFTPPARSVRHRPSDQLGHRS
jgi:Gas vesicle synthesis protein GvpL/GvpF